MPDVAVLSNRLTEALGIRHPIVSAPMAFAAGGALAAAVTRGGGLGLIGGGYGNARWLDEQFIAAGDERVGIGFITWSLARRPELLKDALRRKPVAVMLSFGDPREFAAEIRASGAVLICQCQNLRHVRDAIEAKADIVVAQGSEAGGHGATTRGTFTLVPEVADVLVRESPDTMLLAAGGVADGRGLAAALALGADGVLVGTRLCAAEESLVRPLHRAALVDADGVSTARGGAMSWDSLNTPIGHAGSRQRHIRFSHRTIVTRPRQGASCSIRSRRRWLAAITPHDEQPVST
jgi:nitronate monooxygenase